jgi:hypothetical protein
MCVKVLGDQGVAYKEAMEEYCALAMAAHATCGNNLVLTCIVGNWWNKWVFYGNKYCEHHLTIVTSSNIGCIAVPPRKSQCSWSCVTPTTPFRCCWSTSWPCTSTKRCFHQNQESQKFACSKFLVLFVVFINIYDKLKHSWICFPFVTCWLSCKQNPYTCSSMIRFFMSNNNIILYLILHLFSWNNSYYV